MMNQNGLRAENEGRKKKREQILIDSQNQSKAQKFQMLLSELLLYNFTFIFDRCTSLKKQLVFSIHAKEII